MSNHLKDANKYWFEMSKSSLSAGKETSLKRNIWFSLSLKKTFQNQSIYQYLDILNVDRKSLRHRATYQIHLFSNTNKREIKVPLYKHLVTSITPFKVNALPI